MARVLSRRERVRPSIEVELLEPARRPPPGCHLPTSAPRIPTLRDRWRRVGTPAGRRHPLDKVARWRPTETIPVPEGLFTAAGLLGGQCGAWRSSPLPAGPDLSMVRPRRGERGGAVHRGDPVGLDGGDGRRPPATPGTSPTASGWWSFPRSLRVVSRLTESDPARLAAGQPMALVVVPSASTPTGVDRLTYGFAPRHDGGVEVAGVGIHPFGRFGATDGHRHGRRWRCAPRWPRPAWHGRVPGRLLRHRLRRGRVGPQGAGRASA